MKDVSTLSRAVSRALRHEPWLYELQLDEEGWADVGALLMALRQEYSGWSRLAEIDLAEMIHKSSKQRYEMTNGRIRALYGHSFQGRLQKVPGGPPWHLFHGTAPASESRIRESGLLPMGRQYVHLSIDWDTAAAVGRRKSPNPIVLLVRAKGAWQTGLPFYIGSEKVWLADRVAPQFIDFARRLES